MKRTYLVNVNGQTHGPFTEQELTGKFLRGEIEETTQLCAVGRSSWESLSDWQRKVTARRKLVPLIFGLSFCLVAAACGFKFLALDVKRLQKQVDEYEQSLPEKIAKIENLISDGKFKEMVEARGRRLFIQSVEFSEQDYQQYRAYVKDELSKLKSLVEQDKAGLIQQRDVIRAGMVRMNRMRMEYGVGGGLALALGASMFLIAARIKTVARPGLPGAPSTPPMQSSTSKKPGSQTPPSAPSLNPVAAQSLPKSILKEPKARCSSCQQKIAYPEEMTGQQVNCPTCGIAMNLDNVSDMLS